MTRIVSALVVAALLALAVPAVVDAHFKLLEPASWIVENERGDPQKSAPCGADPKAEMSAAASKVTGGSKLHLKVLETIYHPGHYRVALAQDETGTNLEGLLVGSFDAFRFDSPKLDLATSLFLYPSLSTAGRLRGEATIRLKYELLPDFNVGISATDTFDSDPPEETATTNDFITTFTIGWSYRR